MIEPVSAYTRAVEEDAKGNFGVAIVLYLEAILLDDNVPEEAYANLGVILFLLAVDDQSFEQPISDALGNFGWSNYQVMLQDGLFKYPGSVLIQFWYDYVRSIMGEIDFPQNEYDAYALSLPNDVVLGDEFISVMNSTNPNVLQVVRRSYRPLLEHCKALPTFRNGYVLAVLSSNLVRDQLEALVADKQ